MSSQRERGEKEGFVLYKSFYNPISKLSDKQLGRLFRAIFRYQLSEVVDVEEDIEMAFNFFKNQFEIDKIKYQGKVERDIENGRKGGNPKFKKGNGNPYYTKIKDKDNPTLPKITQDNPPLSKDNPTLPKITQDNPIKDKEKEKDKKEVFPNGNTKKEASASSCLPSADYLKFTKWMEESAPYCADPKNFTQISEGELHKLKESYSGTQIADIILQIENRKDLRKRYSNLYRTVLNWAKKAYGE